MKNYLFYIGHLLVIAFFINRTKVKSNITNFLLPVAGLVYLTAVIKQGKQYREDDEIEVLEEHTVNKTKEQQPTPYVKVDLESTERIQSPFKTPEKTGKTGTVIWRSDFSAVLYWNKLLKGFMPINFTKNTEFFISHNEYDFFEAKIHARRTLQSGNVYFLEDGIHCDKDQAIYETMQKFKDS